MKVLSLILYTYSERGGLVYIGDLCFVHVSCHLPSKGDVVYSR